MMADGARNDESKEFPNVSVEILWQNSQNL